MNNSKSDLNDLQPTLGALQPTLERLSASYPSDDINRQLASLERDAHAIDDPELWLTTALDRGFKDMPIEVLDRCACGSTDHHRLSRFVFWNLLGLRECRECSQLFVSPRLTEDAMHRVFNENYFRGSTPTFWNQRRYPVFRDILRHLRAVGAQRVFDVGAAYGYFVRWLNDQGLLASGCDVAVDVTEWGREHLGVDVQHGTLDTLVLPEESFDAVVSLDTLYYSADPVADLRAMRRLLRSGGHLILRLRNGLPSRRRARREGRTSVGRAPLPAEHLWAFTPGSIVRLLEIAELEVQLVEPGAYPRTMIAPAHAVWKTINRATVRLGLTEIRTLSFTVVARRTG